MNPERRHADEPESTSAAPTPAEPFAFDSDSEGPLVVDGTYFASVAWSPDTNPDGAESDSAAAPIPATLELLADSPAPQLSDADRSAGEIS